MTIHTGQNVRAAIATLRNDSAGNKAATMTEIDTSAEYLDAYARHLEREEQAELRLASAREQASAQMSSVAEMVAAFECDYDRLEELRDSKTMHYVAGWRVPGQLPLEIQEFDDEKAAVEYAISCALEYLNAELPEGAEGDAQSTTEWDANRHGNMLELAGGREYFVTALGKMAPEYDREELAELEDAAGDCESREDAEQRIQEDPLEVTYTFSPCGHGDEPERDGFIILLCTGGPAVRIVGELGAHDEPRRAWLEYQDWFTPWTEYHGENASSEALCTYAACVGVGA